MVSPLFAALPMGANWFDIVWVLALLFGVWSGLRSGALGEVVRLVSWVLMIWLAVTLYVPVGDWLKARTGFAEEPARLLAFVGLVLGVYLVSLAIRRVLQRWTRKSPSAAFLENFGGMMLGVVRMGIVMACLTIWLSLMRSPFWHRHVSKESQFGAAVVKMIPSVKAVTEKTFPERFPLFRDIERPIESDVEEPTPVNKPKKI
jgi:uncharacterized membrane protein required for colicin V production